MQLVSSVMFLTFNERNFRAYLVKGNATIYSSAKIEIFIKKSHFIKMLRNSIYVIAPNVPTERTA